MRNVLFYRKYRRFHGGHLKVWNYFNHVRTAPGFDAQVLFDANSSWDATNPWHEARERVFDRVDQVSPDVLFIAGRDWQRLDALGLLDRDLPILNIIQHVRHAEDWSIQSRYLDRKAIRICVSDEVAEVVSGAGSRGPVVVIPNAVDVPATSDDGSASRPINLFIAGLKNSGTAARAASALSAPDRTIDIVTDQLPRDEFLDRIRRARVSLFLPNDDEGFYLPALEGMALETLVVCPDCVGNRSFCIPGETAFRPDYDFDQLIAATEAALTLPAAEANRMLEQGRAMARRHSLPAEREAFHQVLADLDELWAQA